MSDQAAIAARDVNATPRVLICANVLETTVVPLIQSLLTSWPNARITWATRTETTDSFDPEMWLAAGVELADAADPIWLESRLFHYDAVFLGRPDRRLLDVIERTQPQASHIALADLDPEPDALLAELSDMLAAAGIGPPHSVHKREAPRLARAAEARPHRAPTASSPPPPTASGCRRRIVVGDSRSSCGSCSRSACT